MSPTTADATPMAPRAPRKWIATRDASLWTNLVLLLFAGAVASEAYRLGLGSVYSPGPGFIIFGASTLLGLLALHMLLASLSARPGVEEEAWKGRRSGRAALIVAALLLYAVLLVAGGYLLVTFGLLLFLFWLMGDGRVSWLWILGGAALAAFVTYVVFSRWLSLRFPTGLIPFV